MADMASKFFAVNIYRELKAPGVQALRSLIPLVRATHEAVATERLVKGLTIVRALDEHRLAPEGNPPAVFTNAREITAWYSAHSGPLLVQLTHGGRLCVWSSEVDLESLPCPYVAYQYRGFQQESFITPNGNHDVPTYANFPTYFGIPYFIDLRESLVRYGEISVKTAQCEIFRDTWRQEARISFRNKPEATMRRSLQQYLRASLRDHGPIEVMPEQNVDETHPVDIKVTWTNSNRVALIEIKWLGLSHDELTGRTTPYTQSRAKQGAKQLAEYLDSYHEHSPDQEARGYLAVFDGRRQGISPETTSINKSNGMHFAHREIEYQEEILKREDFEDPVRFFCEPICE
ncbi:hypothetical protein ACFU0X_34050 [Streptomyces cellulosae]|uniref:DUF4263 domain-containing protein n=1 Tax=Streptomyces cellulosae TaxID=1968 RepID=A0ABW6JRF7_STRCE